MRFEMDGDRRHLTFRAQDKDAGAADIDIGLTKDPDNDKMVIATSFAKPNPVLPQLQGELLRACAAMRRSATCVSTWGSKIPR